MTSALTMLLKTCHDVRERVRYRDWSISVHEVDGLVFVQAVGPKRAPNPGEPRLLPGKMIAVSERSSRWDIVRLMHDAVRSALLADIDNRFAWCDVPCFSRSA